VAARFAADQEKAAQRLNDAAEMMTDIMATPDKGIPRDLLENAHCVVVVPARWASVEDLASVCP